MKITPGQFFLIFPCTVAALWLGIGFFISRTGWRAWAQKYATASRPPGRSFRCITARFGGIAATYRNTVHVVFTERGLYLYPIVIFRVFNPPLLVPWAKVGDLSETEDLLGTFVEFQVRDDADEIYLTFSPAAREEYRKFTGA